MRKYRLDRAEREMGSTYQREGREESEGLEESEGREAHIISYQLAIIAPRNHLAIVSLFSSLLSQASQIRTSASRNCHYIDSFPNIVISQSVSMSNHIILSTASASLKIESKSVGT